MRAETSSKLIVRIAEIGFLLDLTQVVEVCEQPAGQLDFSQSDLTRDIVCGFNFRQTCIPVVDPSIALNLCPALKTDERVVLVMCSREGNWGLLVDRVEGITSGERLKPCELPDLLRAPAFGCYTNVALLYDEPMVLLDGDDFYASSAGLL